MLDLRQTHLYWEDRQGRPDRHVEVTELKGRVTVLRLSSTPTPTLRSQRGAGAGSSPTPRPTPRKGVSETHLTSLVSGVRAHLVLPVHFELDRERCLWLTLKLEEVKGALVSLTSESKMRESLCPRLSRPRRPNSSPPPSTPSP